jgi:hypothetical protein
MTSLSAKIHANCLGPMCKHSLNILSCQQIPTCAPHVHCGGVDIQTDILSLSRCFLISPEFETSMMLSRYMTSGTCLHRETSRKPRNETISIDSYFYEFLTEEFSGAILSCWRTYPSGTYDITYLSIMSRYTTPDASLWNKNDPIAPALVNPHLVFTLGLSDIAYLTLCCSF